MIRQAAFDEKRKMLKGGLHCHTTRSDGKGTPEEVIALHVKNGYDFLAITDHRNYNLRNFTELPITIIPGMEMDRNISGKGRTHCFHTVCLGDTENNGYVQDERLPGGYVKDQYEFQAVLDDIHAHNNMTIYCHPEWSATPANEFMALKGNFAMEIWNSGCVMENNMDTNASYWDELLFDGQRIFGVAVDDGHPMEQHCNGWVMVNSENNVPAILDALKNGRFYASTGPEIYDFTFENGVAKVVCSPAARVEFVSWTMPTKIVRGEALTSAEATILDMLGYVRAAVVDAAGRRAWTNPIFIG